MVKEMDTPTTIKVRAKRIRLRTFQEVYQWASQKEPDTFVGISQHSSQCPLATCHKELSGERNWTFGALIVRKRGIRVRNVPAWVGICVERVDAYAAGPQSMTAQDFLTVLDSLIEDGSVRLSKG